MILIDEKKRPEQMRLLATIGYTPKEIGEMLNTSANAVSVALYQSKKKQT